MLTLQEVISRVEENHAKKSDISTTLHSLIPTVGSEGQVKIRLSPKTSYSLTPRGLSSFLEKVKIPGAFFHKCTPELKSNILGEFFPKAPKANLCLRLYEDSIRYFATDKYSTFDDVHIMEALKGVDDLDKYEIKQFYQGLDHFVMRATSREPIQVGESRPFFPGIQIENSETGLGSVSIKYLLFEQVCTNGMTIVSKEYNSFRRVHLGRRNLEPLKIAATDFLLKLDDFTASMEAKIEQASKTKVEDIRTKIFEDSRLPKGVQKDFDEMLKKYTSQVEVPTGLEVLSAFTEQIQRYDWSTRGQLEQIAGEYLLAM